MILKVKCCFCLKLFEKSRCRVNWNKKLGIKNFCSSKHSQKYHVGKKRSEKIKKKISDSHLKLKKKNSAETRKKISKSNKGRRVWNKGIKMPLWIRVKNRKAHIKWYKEGNRHPWNYKGGITKENRKERSSLKYKLWRSFVLKRDQWTCRICGLTNHSKNSNGKKIRLVADHIMPWSLYKKLRYRMYNGRTLCECCHNKYGYRLLAKDRHRWAASPI